MTVCIICNKTFKALGSHLRQTHSIKPREYYDKYIKEDGEGICLVCNKNTQWKSLTKGYSNFCSCKCAQLSPITKYKQRIGKLGVKRPDMVGENNPAKRPEVRKKLSDYMYKNNPMDHKENRDKIKQHMLNNHPMKGKTYEELYGIKKAKELKELRRKQMLNGQAGDMCRKITIPTKPQIKLYTIIKKLYNGSKLEYPFGNYTLDIAIPKYKLDIEYDCSYWHTEEKDKKRDNYLHSKGWKVIRFIDSIPDKNIIYEKTQKLINNGDYEDDFTIKSDDHAKQVAITFADNVG